MSIVDRKYKSLLWHTSSMCLFIILCTGIHGQVTVNMQPQVGVSYTLQDMAMTSYMNTSTGAYRGCYADITADNMSNGQNFIIRTAPFNLSAGVNIPGYTVIVGSTPIRTSDDYYSLEQRGKFPSGKYNLCMVLYSSKGTELGRGCVNLNINADGTLILISPVDEEVLHTFNPMLVWSPFHLFGDNKVTYNIHIAELNEGQSYGDAIGMNPPLVYEHEISAGSYLYPSSAPALEEDKKYVWQVEAMSNGQRISYSEIWMFQFKKTKDMPPEKKPQTVIQQYPHLTKTISSAVYQYSDKIYFMYDNYANDSILDYSVIASGSISPLKMDEKTPVVLKPYNNYLAIPVSAEMKKDGKGKMFALEVHNSRKEKWALKFTINQNKSK